MRKILKKRLFYIICAVFIMLTLVSCGDNDESNKDNDHEHSMVEEIIKEPTCVETGIKKSTCTTCGETKVEEIEAKPHSNDEEVVKPMCEKCGYIYYTKGLEFILSNDRKSYSVSMYNIDVTDQDNIEIVIPSSYKGIPVVNIYGASINDIINFKVTYKPLGTIKKLVIPNSVKTIHTNAFVICSTIQNLITPMLDYSFLNELFENTGIDMEIGKMTITNGESISDSAFKELNINEVVISESVKNIGNNAFYGCENLISIEIPDSVTSIGDSAFYGCEKLTSIEIPDSVTSIGDSAFYGCEKLTSIEIPDSVTSIGICAFAECDMLEKVVLSNKIKKISEYMFNGCSSLKEINIPEGVEIIESDAFSYTKLTKIVLPKTIIEIEIFAFAECKSLDYIYYRGSEEQWNLIEIGYNMSLSYVTIEYNYQD